MQPTIFLRKAEVFRRTGMSDTTVWRKEKAGEFPKRVKITGKIVGWDEAEIEAYQQALLAERDDSQAAA